MSLAVSEIRSNAMMSLFVSVIRSDATMSLGVLYLKLDHNYFIIVINDFQVLFRIGWQPFT